MNIDFFDYLLPESLIAQYPLKQRDASRLLCLNKTSGELADNYFYQIPQLLQPSDLLVLNDTKVIPARLFGKKATGGRVEFLLERILNDQMVLGLIASSKPPKKDSVIKFDGNVSAYVVDRDSSFYKLQFCTSLPIFEVFKKYGHMPLPPYIKRTDQGEDREAYQTIYAHKVGAVAAPTAGLHFTQSLFDALDKKKIHKVFITLHVGAGTFQPVRVADLNQHVMHAESVQISNETCAVINNYKKNGGRIIAVGTTTVRALESAAKNGRLESFQGETNLFVTPGFHFQVIDGLITNFHLPKSTLLALVSALAGRDNIMRAYQYAVDKKYRFYSYGDAMLIL